MRSWKRRSCSSSLTLNQYLMRMMSDRMQHALELRAGAEELLHLLLGAEAHARARRRPGCTSCGRRGPSRRPPAGARRSAGSTTAVFSRSVGVGSATTRTTRGFSSSVMRLMAPPLPAASRPSKMTATLRPWLRTHSCSLTSSRWSLASSRSYVCLSSLPPSFSLSSLAIFPRFLRAWRCLLCWTVPHSTRVVSSPPWNGRGQRGAGRPEAGPAESSP